MYYLTQKSQHHTPWNKNKLVGQKAPLKLKEICAIRIHLQLQNNVRDLALFNLAIDSKLRASDLVKLKLKDVSHGNSIEKRAIILQQKTQQHVKFEITEITRETLGSWVKFASLQRDDDLFKRRVHRSAHL